MKTIPHERRFLIISSLDPLSPVSKLPCLFDNTELPSTSKRQGRAIQIAYTGKSLDYPVQQLKKCLLMPNTFFFRLSIAPRKNIISSEDPGYPNNTQLS